MNDFRKRAKLPIQGNLITAGLEINEINVKEMLTLMGVNNDNDAIVKDAIGYLSANGMEINMNNLYSFLKGRNIMSGVKDFRLKKN